MRTLFLAALLLGQAIQPGGAITTTHGTSYPDIRFWLNFEANDTTGDYNMGASECSAGDSAGAFNSSATILSSTPKVGSYYLYASSPDGNDYMRFSVTTDDIVSGTEMRLGFWFRAPSLTDSLIMIDGDFNTDASNYFFLRLSGSDEVNFRWRVGGSNEIDASSTTANLSTDTWYFAEIEMNTATNVLRVYINGTAVITDTSTNTTAISGMEFLTLNAGDVGHVLIDNVMISNDSDRDFYTDGTSDLSVTTSKPTGACS